MKNVTKSAEVEAGRAGFSSQLRDAESLLFVPVDSRPATHQQQTTDQLLVLTVRKPTYRLT